MLIYTSSNYILCSNIYLVKVLKSFENFAGAFPCDKIPQINFEDEDYKSVITNTREYGDNFAGHWLLVTLFRKN